MDVAAELAFRTQILALAAEMESMKAANACRVVQQQSPAFCEAEFLRVVTNAHNLENAIGSYI